MNFYPLSPKVKQFAVTVSTTLCFQLKKYANEIFWWAKNSTDRRDYDARART